MRRFTRNVVSAGLISLGWLGAPPLPAHAEGARVFMLAGTHGSGATYRAFEERPWPALEQEAASLARVAAALARERDTAAMLIAPDEAARERAEAALGRWINATPRRAAVRRAVGPLKPGILLGSR